MMVKDFNGNADTTTETLSEQDNMGLKSAGEGLAKKLNQIAHWLRDATSHYEGHLNK